MIKGTCIHKSYGELEVLKGIDIEIGKGEVVAIIGASGAGKSTLLHILGTLDLADSGIVNIDGEDVTALKGHKLAKFRNRHIGFVFQFHHLLPEFTAVENICIPAFINQVSESEAIIRASALLEKLKLPGRNQHRPSQLSGGEQQRVAVARALINNPKVVLADEPSGNLDSKNAIELHKLFFDLRDQLNQTFIIATHNEQLAEMADRRLRIKDGKILDLN